MDYKDTEIDKTEGNKKGDEPDQELLELKAYEQTKLVVEAAFLDPAEKLKEIPLFLSSLKAFPGDYLCDEGIIQTFINFYALGEKQVYFPAMQVLLYIMQHVDESQLSEIIDDYDIRERTLFLSKQVISELETLYVIKIITIVSSLDASYFDNFLDFYRAQLKKNSIPIKKEIVTSINKLIKETFNENVRIILMEFPIPFDPVELTSLIMESHLILAKDNVLLFDLDTFLSLDFEICGRYILLILLELASKDDELCGILASKKDFLTFILSSKYPKMTMALFLLIAGSPASRELLGLLGNFVEIYFQTSFDLKIATLKIVLQILVKNTDVQFDDTIYDLLLQSLSYPDHDVLMMGLIILIRIEFFSDELVSEAEDLVDSDDKEVALHAEFYLKKANEARNDK